VRTTSSIATRVVHLQTWGRSASELSPTRAHPSGYFGNKMSTTKNDPNMYPSTLEYLVVGVSSDSDSDSELESDCTFERHYSPMFYLLLWNTCKQPLFLKILLGKDVLPQSRTIKIASWPSLVFSLQFFSDPWFIFSIFKEIIFLARI
jgi:hypothetical protein